MQTSSTRYWPKLKTKSLCKLLGTFPCNYNDEMKIILSVLTKMLKYKDVSLVVETTKCQHLQKLICIHSTYMAFHIYKMCCIVCTYHLNTLAGCKRADRESKRFQIEIRTIKLNSGNRYALKKKLRDYLGIFPTGGGGSSQFPKLL